MKNQKEKDTNLIIVATIEEYGLRHNMEVLDVLELFKQKDIIPLLRSQYDVLHTMDLSEGVDFVESFLEDVVQ